MVAGLREDMGRVPPALSLQGAERLLGLHAPPAYCQHIEPWGPGQLVHGDSVSADGWQLRGWCSISHPAHWLQGSVRVARCCPLAHPPEHTAATVSPNKI